MVGDGEKRMAKILRERALKIINKTYEVINEELKKKQGEHNIWLKYLSDRMERINKLRVQTDYFEIIGYTYQSGNFLELENAKETGMFSPE